MKVRLRLKEVLLEKDVSQSKLSRLADVSLNTIQAIVRDPYRGVELETLLKLARALNVAITDLYEELPE